MALNIDDIRALASAQITVRWSLHALKRMAQRNIAVDDCINCLLNGEIIEDYPTDYPFPSCLMLEAMKPLHVVCALGEGVLTVITAYILNPEEWSEDLRRRKGL